MEKQAIVNFFGEGNEIHAKKISIVRGFIFINELCALNKTKDKECLDRFGFNFSCITKHLTTCDQFIFGNFRIFDRDVLSFDNLEIIHYLIDFKSTAIKFPKLKEVNYRKFEWKRKL